ILDAIVESESLQVEQGELMEQIVFNAQRLGMAPEVFAQRLAQGQGAGLTQLMADVLRNKATLLLLEKATVVDQDDNPVTLELPKRPEATAEDGEAEAHDHDHGHDHEGHDHEH
ncbi:MAG: trigger factor, partial [Frankia sp.]|nr:trigger factor [Frankia sp.]